MASIVLSTAGSALGSAIGGPSGALIGNRLGRFAGSVVDSELLGRDTKFRTVGPRLEDLGVQTSTYGKMIPIVYGTIRTAGNVIWSRPIKETVTTTTSSSGGGGGGKGGGGTVTQSTTTYSYSVSLAIGICEGPVNEIQRVWADARQLDLSQLTIRIYKGNETQLPDSYIQSFEGSGSTPAYRGLAYVVIEDFPLGDFGNRIPNFTFEVKRKFQYPDYDGEILEDMIESMIMIPGAGEYVYDTVAQYKQPGVEVGGQWIRQGAQQPLNKHNPYNKANALLALDQLEATCPNVEWIGVVVSWFGNSLDAADCTVLPGVEYKVGAETTPDVWEVAGFTRATAQLITQIGGAPQYGGTPDDSSVVRLLTELRGRGYKVMLYPMLFMDVSGKPWRGELTGAAADVSGFFTKTNGYNAFITHYANLTAGKVDAFVIGSELVGLTKVTDTPGNYPAVTRLVSLAATVKGILGSGVKVTYAADWSEYHHTDGGWYNLDPLWASSNIDMIGIDAYFPLRDSPENTYDVDTIKAGWTAGEGYDWYYSDPERTTKAPLDEAYAWKNIEWFWNNTHYNPGSVTTDWTPQSKKIWFTEFGFPSVDNAANQPNVFYDPSTAGSAFPRFSKGRVDFRAQRAALTATQAQWQDSDMVERMFVWTWDARPYPYWPDLTRVWSDGTAWKTGHWVQGKLGISSLAAVVADVCARCGLAEEDIQVSGLTEQIEGFILTSQQTVRDVLEQLQLAYFFDAVESEYTLKFIPRGNTTALSIPASHAVPKQVGGKRQALLAERIQEMELPRRVNFVYLNRLNNYQPALQYAQREATASNDAVTINVPLVISDQVAKTVADINLYSRWAGRTRYRMELSISYGVLEPADVVEVEEENATHRLRITQVRHISRMRVEIAGVSEDNSIYDFYTAPAETNLEDLGEGQVAETQVELLDLPAMPGDGSDAASLRVAAAGIGTPWRGAVLFRSDDGGGNYNRLLDLPTASLMGTCVTALDAGPTQVMDETSSVTVALLGEAELYSATLLAVLNGANAALVGDEIIQFTTATLVEPQRYTLSGLLRGRLGTEHAVAGHTEGERFVLLDGRVAKQAISRSVFYLPRSYKGISVGDTLESVEAEDFTYQAVALKPYAPVHVTGVRDGSGNLSISWVRRVRVGGDWQDYTDTPLSEAFEAYEVEVLDGSTVVRTIANLSTPAASYTAAQQTTDFGSPQANVAVRIYQLSAQTGRGYPAEATI